MKRQKSAKASKRAAVVSKSWRSSFRHLGLVSMDWTKWYTGFALARSLAQLVLVAQYKRHFEDELRRKLFITDLLTDGNPGLYGAQRTLPTAIWHVMGAWLTPHELAAVQQVCRQLRRMDWSHVPDSTPQQMDLAKRILAHSSATFAHFGCRPTIHYCPCARDGALAGLLGTSFEFQDGYAFLSCGLVSRVNFCRQCASCYPPGPTNRPSALDHPELGTITRKTLTWRLKCIPERFRAKTRFFSQQSLTGLSMLYFATHACSFNLAAGLEAPSIPVILLCAVLQTQVVFSLLRLRSFDLVGFVALMLGAATGATEWRCSMMHVGFMTVVLREARFETPLARILDWVQPVGYAMCILDCIERVMSLKWVLG